MIVAWLRGNPESGTEFGLRAAPALFEICGYTDNRKVYGCFEK